MHVRGAVAADEGADPFGRALAAGDQAFGAELREGELGLVSVVEDWAGEDWEKGRREDVRRRFWGRHRARVCPRL